MGKPVWDTRRDNRRHRSGHSSRKQQTASKVDVDIDLTVQEVAQDATLQDEAITQEIDRVKAGSNKISIRNDFAKDEVIFFEESSRAVFEMGNVEQIELIKTSETIQCPSCLTYLRVWLFVNVKNYYDPKRVRWTGSEKHSRQWKPLVIVLHQLFREERKEIIIPGNKTIIKPETHWEVQRRRKSILRWDRWQNDEVYRASQVAHTWTDEWVNYLDIIMHFDISHNAPSWQRARKNNMIHLRSLDSNKQAGWLCKRLGYKEATRALIGLQYADWQGVPEIPVRSKTRQNDTLDPDIGWSARNRKIQNAINHHHHHHHHHRFSSWSPSPTRWSSSFWDPNWQEWHSHGWQDNKWWDKR